MMKLISTSIFLFAFFLCLIRYEYAGAQGLVPNNGFEVQDTCPLVSQVTLAHPWNSPTLGTPDLFNHNCSTQNLTAHTGHGSSGVYVFNLFPDNREYIQARLTSPLSSGQIYCVSFWVKRVNYRYATNRMGAYFSTDSIFELSTSNLDFTPQVDNPPTNMLSGNDWIQIDGSFTANDGEKYIIIGNFATDAETDTAVANSASTSLVGFYAIDDIVVTTCTGIDDADGQNNFKVFPSPASDEVHVQLSENLPAVEISLINSNGQRIPVDDAMRSGDGDFVVKVQDQTPGLYLLVVSSGETQFTRRILIAR